MKTKIILRKMSATLLSFILTISFATVSAQESTKVNFREDFDNLIVSGTIKVLIEHSDNPSMELITPKYKTFDDVINYSIEDNTLNVTGKKDGDKLRGFHFIKNLSNYHDKDKIELKIFYTNLKNIKLSSVASISNIDKLQSQELSIETNGASELNLDIEVEKLNVLASGASSVKLNGKAASMDIKITGASTFKGYNLDVSSANIETTGASSAYVNVVDYLKISSTGVSNVKMKQEPKEIVTEVSGMSEVSKNGDEDNNEDIGKKSKKKKFDGHWGGIELGINSIVDPSFKTFFPDNYDYLNINQTKSWTVNINAVEQNFPIVVNKFGLVTGLGLWINNYRFKNNLYLIPDSSVIHGYLDTTRVSLKSKLTASHIVLPLLLEYQIHNKEGKARLHIAAGGYAGVMVQTRAINVYEFEGSKVKVKNVDDDYHLNPFRYGLMFRIGWSNFNVFANYNLSTFFKDGKGPEMYPFEAGITLVGW